MPKTFFYHYSFEAFTREGLLKTKGYGTIIRGGKIHTTDGLESFTAKIREIHQIPEDRSIHLVSISLLNP